jgi:hypothetical protein
MTVQEAMFVEIEKRLAPARIANLQTNADQIALYLKKNKLEWSADNVVTAINALHIKGLILWEVDPIPPSQPTKAERDAKQAAQQYLDIIKNKPGRVSVADTQRFNTEAAQDAKKIVEAKQLETLKAEVAREINGYMKGHPSGGTNFGLTEAGQAKLRAVAANYNQLQSIDAVKAVLENVKAAKYRLP